MHDKFLDILLSKEEVTWQTLLYDLIRSEEMNPWDVDISLLAKKYVDIIRQLQEANFFISGKVLLAAALLLKIKSDRLLGEDIAAFDAQLYPVEETEPEFEEVPLPHYDEFPALTIKTPMPRKRRVNLQDLMSALKQALDVNERRVVREMEAKKIDVAIPEKIDITNLIKEMYDRIVYFFKTKSTLTFTELSGEHKQDKVLTLLPLLHLDHQEKISLKQNVPFGEITVRI